MTLKDWEIQTIEALADEALERAGRDVEIRRPDLWLDKAIRDRQVDAEKDPAYRKQLTKQADRLGIGIKHPSRDWETEEVRQADPETIHRWGRIQSLCFALPDDHEWIVLYRELVTARVVESRHTAGWHVPDDGMGILEVLEIEARRLELIGLEDAEPISVSQLLATMVSRVGPKARVAA